MSFRNYVPSGVGAQQRWRELDTGRHSFLHTSSGSPQPFDSSVHVALRDRGVNVWSIRGNPVSFEGLREEDTHGAGCDLLPSKSHACLPGLARGLDVIRANAEKDPWLVYIDCVAPSAGESSLSDSKQHSAVADTALAGSGPQLPLASIEENRQGGRRSGVNSNQISPYDHALTSILDCLDELDLWQETLVVVGGAHGQGPDSPRAYGLPIKMPLFIWDPRVATSGEIRKSLVQTTDFAPTLLDFFEAPRASDVQGKSLEALIRSDIPVRDAGLFGTFGSRMNVTDGQYVYMRGCATRDNQPLFEYTLSPLDMPVELSLGELAGSTLAEEFSFSRGIPLLRIPRSSKAFPNCGGSFLFDLASDPRMANPIVDADLELRMATLIAELMWLHEAPTEQYERVGLPRVEAVTRQHLQISKDLGAGSPEIGTFAPS
nr:sulfatase/phosphatase domain-containing protein [Arthrobacter sp. yr096]